MKFAALNAQCAAFCDALNGTAHEPPLIERVSVVAPEEPEDERHFLRLVVWCYAFLHEAGSGPIRYLTNLLRGTSPDCFKTVDLALRTVRDLRTHQVHHLSQSSKGDARTLGSVNTWFAVHSSGNQWSDCSQELCRQVGAAIKCLTSKWVEVVDLDGSDERMRRQLFVYLTNTWAGHEFDRLVERAATELGIQGLDVVKYRDARLPEWRKLAAFFPDREASAKALDGAIRSELYRAFIAPVP